MSHTEEVPSKALKIDHETEQAEDTEVVSADDSDLTEVSETGELLAMADSTEMAEVSEIIGVSALGAVPSITEVTDIAASEMEEPEIQESELEMPGVKESELEMPGVQESELEMPGIQETELEMPGDQESELEMPGDQESELEMPGDQESELEMPGVQESEMEIPGVQESEMGIPAVQESEMEMSGVKESEIGMPESQESEMDLPGSQESEVGLSGAQESEVETPGVRQSDMEMPEIQESEMGMPEIQESEMEMPEIQESENYGESNMPGMTESDISVSDLIQVSDLTGPNIQDMRAKPEEPPIDKTVAEIEVNVPAGEVTSGVEAVEASEGQEQEEWLSDGVLTDDDFNPAAQDQTDSQTSQLENGVTETTTKVETPEAMEQANIASIFKEKSAKSVQQNIEDALNTLEGNDEQNDDLDKYLIKKSDIKTESSEKQVKTENLKQEQDDGNDTDDLLRMLGDDDSKAKKKMTKTVKDIRAAAVKCESSDDDDDFVFEGAAAKKLKVAKALSKKPAIKAEPEHSDPGAGLSSDEASTLQKMFKSNKSGNSGKSGKHTVVNKPRSDAKSVASLGPKKDKLTTSTPLKPDLSKSRSLLKANMAPRARTDLVKREPGVLRTYSRVKNPVTTPVKLNEPEKLKMEIEEYLDEDFDIQDDELESDFEEEVAKRQRIMKPERMEEEMLSDGESHSEDGSLYDELPSSDSEGMEDWFQLDIRAEKAGDYLPLLGSRAKQLLLEEKNRCGMRLTNLKQSLSALTESGKKQAELVRTATLQLAELDDMLKSS